MILNNSERCFWREIISSRVDEAANLLIVVDNAKSHKVREAASLAFGLTSVHSCNSRSSGSGPHSCSSSTRRSNRWETTCSTPKVLASPQTNSVTNIESESSESSDSSDNDYEGDNCTFANSSSSQSISPIKAPQDTTLRVPTRRISDPVPVRIASIDWSVLCHGVGAPTKLSGKDDSPSSPQPQIPTDTTLRLPKRRPSDDPSIRMTTVMESQTLTLTSDVVEGAPVRNDKRIRAPERKLSDVSSTSSASSSSGRPLLQRQSKSCSSLSEPSALWHEQVAKSNIKKPVQMGPRLPVRRKSFDIEGLFELWDTDDEPPDEEYPNNATTTTAPTGTNPSLKRALARASSASLLSSSSADKTTKKKNLDKLIDEMLDQFERDPTALIEQALAKRKEEAMWMSNKSN